MIGVVNRLMEIEMNDTSMNTATVKADKGRIDWLKHQLRSTPQELDWEWAKGHHRGLRGYRRLPADPSWSQVVGQR